MTTLLERRQAVELRMAALAPLLGLPLNPAEQLQARSPAGIKSTGEILWWMVWSNAEPDGWGAGAAGPNDPSQVRGSGFFQFDIYCIPASATTTPYRVFDVIHRELRFEVIGDVQTRTVQPPRDITPRDAGMSRFQITVPFYVLDL